MSRLYSTGCAMFWSNRRFSLHNRSVLECEFGMPHALLLVTTVGGCGKKRKTRPPYKREIFNDQSSETLHSSGSFLIVTFFRCNGRFFVEQ
jgi:hypothetical protein